MQFAFFGPAVKRLRNWLYRGTNDESLESMWLNRAKILFILTLGSMLLLVLVFLLNEETNRWQNHSAGVTLSPTRWRLWIESGSVTCAATSLDANCPQALWLSQKHRGSEKGLINKPFWLGYELTPQESQTALAERANYLILGWVRGDYTIFVDGQEIAKGKRTYHEPIIFPLPLNWLEHKNGMRIAVRILPQADADNPDVFSKPFPEQLATADDATASLSATEFYKKSRPFALLTINLALAAIFFLIWFADREVREAFYLSLYALLSATLQLRLSDIYLGQFPAAIDYNLDFILRFYEGSLGLLLGMAFARIRREVFITLIPLMVFLPFRASCKIVDIFPAAGLWIS